MSTMTRIDNTVDVIDSRDIIARIAQLQHLRQPGPVPDGVLEPEDDETDQDSLFAELATLEGVAEQASSSPDWEYGEQLIRYSYFEDYAMQLADDIGAIDSRAGWPLTCIDWEEAAEQLKQDYFAVDYDGIEYFIRG